MTDPDAGYPPAITGPERRYVGVCRNCKRERVLTSTVYTLDADCCWRGDICGECQARRERDAQPEPELIIDPAWAGVVDALVEASFDYE